MRKEKELERAAKTLWPCPQPAFISDKNIQRVGKAYLEYEAGERLLKERPALFHRLAGWLDAEAEATPILDKNREIKRERERKHKDAPGNNRRLK